MQQIGRWFLAHSRGTSVPEIEQMCAELEPRLCGGGWLAQVTPGRDDFSMRAAAEGGWKGWARGIGVAESWDGSPLYHGCVVPVHTRNDLWVGRATADIVQSFLWESKHAMLWILSEERLVRVTDIQRGPDDEYKRWAKLIIEGGAE